MHIIEQLRDGSTLGRRGDWLMCPVKGAPAGDECFICRGLAESDDRKNLIVLRTPSSVVLLNRYPYNNGHLLIAPRAHKGASTN